MSGMQNAKAKVYASILVVPLALLVALTYVRRRVVPAGAETTIRSLAEFLGLFAVPFLITFAFRRWTIEMRQGLPAWRKVIGFGSMAVLFTSWLVYSMIFAMTLLRVSYTFNLDWTAILLEISLFGAILGMALKGASRALALSATILVFTYLQSEIYR